MEEMIINEIFDLEQHVALFRKKKKFQITHLSEIDKVLNSIEYSRFINSVYNFFNKNVSNVDGRLALKYYSDAEIIIDRFWNRLLGNELNNKFKSRIQSKLNF
ncbi:MAG: hypothetical protein ACTSP9_14720 [Promethearchaeota archaeon]